MDNCLRSSAEKTFYSQENNMLIKVFRDFCLVIGLVLFGNVITVVNGHGRLLDPPSRSSLWRFKESNEMIKNSPRAGEIKANYNDNQLFCGGASYQQSVGGKCGVCGDSYADPQPRQNEANGKYGLGIITRQYSQGGWIDVRVELTANHKGYFEFRLCEWNDITSVITHECLDENLLETEYGYKVEGINHNGDYNIRMKLPDDVTCSQCVLQWKYNTGNSWGCDETGCAVGKGPQEQFYGCSDIKIIGDGEITPIPISTSTSTSSSNTATSTSTSTTPASTSTISTSTTSTSPGADMCETAEYGRYYNLDCVRFFVCLQGYPGPLILYCPPTLKYDEGRHICDYSYNVPPPCGKAPQSY